MNYLEDYVDILQILPHEIQKQFTQLCEKDSISKRIDDSITDMVNTLLKEGENMAIDERKKLVTRANEIFDESVNISKEKLAIATATYEIVDKHIRRLDTDFNRYQTALSQFKSSTAPQYEREQEFRTGEKTHKNFPGNLKSASSHVPLASMKRPSQVAPRLKRASKKKRPKGAEDDAVESIAGSNGEYYDDAYPIDPNEPTYCHCGQVSFGEMIACDNEECNIKWFHWECIGLKTLPKGKWFCPECSSKKKKPSK